MEVGVALQLLIVCLLSLAALSSSFEFPDDLETQWLNHGGGLQNQRYACGDPKIFPKTAKKLALKWEFVTGGDVSVTPAIYKGALYFPGWNGFFYAVNESTGTQIWSKNLAQLTGFNTGALQFLEFGAIKIVVSRSTPVVYGDVLLVGLWGPAAVIALDRHTGSLLWSRLLDDHPYALITQSGTAYKGFLYVGVSSFEETVAAEAAYDCCSFIGSMVKVDIRSGRVEWKTLMLPDNGGSRRLYAGAAVWGSSPAIDENRQLLYIATGNLYRAPPAITACGEAQANSKRTLPVVPDLCVEAENLSNGVVALELGSGRIRWGKSLGGYDAWTLACLIAADSPNCPAGPADDYDFGQAPMLLTIPTPDPAREGWWNWRDVAVAAQKSGIVWALDRDTGDVVWDTVTGPGGRGGGAQWGSATDGRSVFVNNGNSQAKNFTIVTTGEVITGGAWTGLDAFTGEILWVTPVPDGTGAQGPLTLANGVVFGSSNTDGGDVYALDSKTGAILWHSSVPVGTVRGGFSVSHGCAYVGSGYVAGAGTPGTSLYAFCVD